MVNGQEELRCVDVRDIHHCQMLLELFVKIHHYCGIPLIQPPEMWIPLWDLPVYTFIVQIHP